MVAVLTVTACSAANQRQCSARVASGAAATCAWSAGTCGGADLGRATRPGPRRHRLAARVLGGPAGHGARTDAEEADDLGSGQAGVTGLTQPLAEVGRILLHTPSVPPCQLIRKLL